MGIIPCNNCQQLSFAFILQKESPLGEIFSVVRCHSCGLVQVNPQPSPQEVLKYYNDSYFTQRTDRGYDNYYSDELRKEISRVFRLNLQDLGFFSWETEYRKQNKELRSLDIGCAAGYFVDFMKQKSYTAEGIEVAEGPVRFARETLGLHIHQEDFLDWDPSYQQKYDLITLWATIEHLHKPKETLQKIHKHLNPGGLLIVSTCRYGILAKSKGIDWRYLNVPEHLYYYSMRGLSNQIQEIGFELKKYISYGSGMTTKKGAGLWFKTKKAILDRLVKWTNQGDMMAISAIKP
ncbi:methyltransferase/methylase [Leptospira ryugenii]|uniref:Methyltransferase/methylase n=1 Tax=Leptospira ryugenii TaxID=1917863 RepID=A0A2P2DVM7_9LEPT|nr:class I SAM-dependent methyltransferase [Leptospira ryugenii]GBF48683.1 methyltransferase/methylase [Leptospira ryugenii]